MMHPKPLEYSEYYHIYNRGIDRGNLFFEERNYRHFLKLYTRHVTPVADTFAYCLLPNHFHFLVRIRDLSGLSNLTGLLPSKRFSNLFNAYTKAVNKAYSRTGSLFQRPFGRIQVTDDAYFARLVIYIHHNPQKHGLVDDYRSWVYSSYGALVGGQVTRLERDAVLGWFGDREMMLQTHKEQMSALLPEDFD